MLLALGGGIGGLLIGIATTAVTALTGGQPIVVPLAAAAGGVAVAVGVGIAAGGYPAVRAARMVPAAALRAV